MADNMPRHEMSQMSTGIRSTQSQIKPTLEIDIDLSDKTDYLDSIKEFKKTLTQPQLDIHPSWSGLTISETSRDQLEMQIQAERILNILNNACDKLQFVGAIPQLLRNDCELIKKYLSSEEADVVIRRFSKFSDSESDSLRKQIKVKSLVGCFLDVDIQEAFSYIQQNQCLNLYVKQSGQQLDPFSADLVKSMNELTEILKEKLKTTAADERDRRARLKIALRDTKERSLNIKRLGEKLTIQVREMAIKLQDKNVSIERTKKKIEEIKSKFKRKISDVVNLSEKAMMIEWDESEAKQMQLAAEAKTAQQQYQLLLDQHLADEKLLRAKRLKVEAQLANWLSKYDTDIGERQAQMDELMEGYEEEKEQLTELENMIAEQNILYDEYFEEKTFEDIAAFRHKVEQFMEERSAKIIQRAWRAYKARKLARKRARRARAAARAAKKAAKKAGRK